jgi:ABC-type antimicrobial peptide transport system permease subunit
VKRFFKSDEDPLDQHFGIDLPENAGTYRIVGIVRDAKFAGWAVDKPARPMFYVPLTQSVAYSNDLMKTIELRSHFIGGIMLVTNAAPGRLEPILTEALAEVDPNLTMTSVRTMREQVDLSFDQERAVASLAGLFGIVALLLAAVGLYGVTAYTVAQRTREIGIRMALGADARAVRNLVMREGWLWTALGTGIGLAASVALAGVVSSLLYGVTPRDPVTLAGATLLLAIVALAACYLPARRATKVDAMRTLRAE